MQFPSRTTRLAACVVVPFAGILLLNISRYWPFISDDALISLRYAARLLEGYGLTWTAGQPVEGYSNLLWILLVALAGLFGADLVVAARAFGIAGMIAVMFCVAHEHVRRDERRASWFPVALALLFLALAAPIAVWAIGGLEQPLYGALIAVAIPLTFGVLRADRLDPGRTWWLSGVLGLLCLTRPDGPLFAVATAVSLLVAGWLSGRRSLMAAIPRLLLFPALFSAGQLLFRLSYYGEILPNTALVKMPRSLARWTSGLDYVTAGFTALAPLSWLAVAFLVVLIAARRTRAVGVYLATVAIAWSAYVAFIGGDIFPAYRHFVPLLVVFAFALAEGALLVMQRLAHRPRLAIAVATLGLLLLVPYTHRQIDDKHSERAVRERWEWDCRELALQLKAAFERQQPLVAVTAAGCLPYWSELPALDMLGLNDHYLPRHRPADAGGGFIGHELGDGQYVMRSNPDLIVFNVGSGPHFRSGEELARMPEFHERYVPVVLATQFEGYAARIYVNKYSEKPGIGVSRAANAVTVPGLLFTGEGTRAAIGRGDRLVAQIRGPATAEVRFTSAESLAGWEVAIRAPRWQAIVGRIEQEGDAVSVTLSPLASDPVELEEVVLSRPARQH